MLTASAGKWTTGTTLAVAWLRAGKMVAITPTYTLAATDAGKASR